MNEPRELLTSADVARLLRVHPKQIYRLLARGLPGHRVGSEWRFLREEVLAWSGMSDAGSSRAAPADEESAGTPPPLLGANGDVVVELLLAQLTKDGKPLLGLVTCDRGQALKALAEHRLLLAGFHGEVPPSHAGKERLARIHLVKREIGLAFAPGTKLRSLKDLAQKRVGLRPPTAGIRRALDDALHEARMSLSGDRAKHRTYPTHRDAVCAVLRQDVDVALTTAAWAERTGLRLFSLGVESYDLLLHAADLGSAPVVGVCEVAQSRAFRRGLASVAGYDPRDAGAIRYEA